MIFSTRHQITHCAAQPRTEFDVSFHIWLHAAVLAMALVLSLQDILLKEMFSAVRRAYKKVAANTIAL